MNLLDLYYLIIHVLVSTLIDSNRNATGNAPRATAKRRTRRAGGTSTAASSQKTTAARSVYENGKNNTVVVS